jgi:RHS repeat-associated protein
MTDATGTTSYTSNADGQPTTVTSGAGQTVSYAYNPDGNPTTITYPSGKNVTDTYNAGQQLTAVTDWNSNQTSFGYTKDGVLDAETYPSGDTAADTVSKDDQVTAITDKNSAGTTLAAFTYTRGKDSELTALTTTGTAISAPAQNYTYSPLSQLTGTGTASYAYDNAADPVTLGAATQTFSPGGQLASETTGGTTTSFAWDTIASVPLLLAAGTTSYLYGPGGLPVESLTSAGTPTYYLQDQLGSTRLLTSSTGAYTYDPWGNTTSHTGTATTQLLYAGQYQDPASGLYYLRNRWYDPATAQFLTIDPAIAQTQAPYTYTSDNPLSQSDPTGLCAERDGGTQIACTGKPVEADEATSSPGGTSCPGSSLGYFALPTITTAGAPMACSAGC